MKQVKIAEDPAVHEPLIFGSLYLVLSSGVAALGDYSLAMIRGSSPAPLVCCNVTFRSARRLPVGLLVRRWRVAYWALPSLGFGVILSDGTRYF